MEHEEKVFLVNYDQWCSLKDIDLEQNYFAIEDPYEDEDYRLLWLQNDIKDITPAGTHFIHYEEAKEEIDKIERKIANLPFNKQNKIGSYLVEGREQLKLIMEARAWKKHLDLANDKVSYYVIEDLSTWAENAPQRSELERFEHIEDAVKQFEFYRHNTPDQRDDKVKTTLGVNVSGIEFDVIHVKNNEKLLILDFTHSQTATESQNFRLTLQRLSREPGFDKVRVHREMTSEEVKDFVKKRFEYNLHRSGLDDDDSYLGRFDELYAKGNLNNLLPSKSQRHIVEDIPFGEWDNTYFPMDSVNQAEKIAQESSVLEQSLRRKGR